MKIIVGEATRALTKLKQQLPRVCLRDINIARHVHFSDANKRGLTRSDTYTCYVSALLAASGELPLSNEHIRETRVHILRQVN
jgi:hypothetical protein